MPKRKEEILRYKDPPKGSTIWNLARKTERSLPSMLSRKFEMDEQRDSSRIHGSKEKN